MKKKESPNLQSSQTDERKPESGKRRSLWIRIIAVVLAAALIVAAVYTRLNSVTVNVVEDQPTDNLAEEDLRVLMEDPMGYTARLRSTLSEMEEVSGKLEESRAEAQKKLEEGDYEGAIEPLQYILEHGSLTEEEEQSLNITLAQLEFSAGRYEDAGKLCGRLISEGLDTDGTLFFMQGVCRIMLGRYEDALKSFEDALAKGYSDTSSIYVHMAFCEHYLEDYDRVLEDLNEAEKTGVSDEYSMTVAYLKAIALMKTEDYAGSVEYLNVLLEDPEYAANGELWYYRGSGELALKEYEKAAEDFDRAIELYDTGDAAADGNSGGTAGAGDTTGSEGADGGSDNASGQGDVSAQADTGDDYLTTLYYNRATAYLGAGELEAAAEDYQKVVDRGDSPDLTEASEEILKLIEEAQDSASGTSGIDAA